MKKICFVDFNMSVTGGVEQVTASLANEFCKYYKVFIYEINPGSELAYNLDGRVCMIKGKVGSVRLREMLTGNFRRFIHFINAFHVDIVLLMGNYPALVVSPARFFTKAKYVYCDHGALMNEWRKRDITAIRFLDSLIAHKIVVLTKKTREDYIKKFHTKPGKIQCIYNWIPDSVFAIKKPYDAQSHKILSVGRFGKEKGYDMLVKVAEKVLPRYPQWQWHVYGTGEVFDEILAEVKRLGLGTQLILKGNVKDVYQMFSEYAFIVLPSYREGLPLVLLEATALGLPMISFDIETGPNEIIVDGRNGFLIQPYDLESMMKRIEELINDAEKRIIFSEYQGRKDKFKKEKILKQWIRFIEDLYEK